MITTPSLDRCLNAICQEAPLIDDHPTARKVSIVALIILAVVSEIPFIRVSLPLGQVAGPIAAIANTATFCILNYWCTQSMIYSAFGAKTQEEIDLLAQNTSTVATCKKVSLLTIAALVSMASQIPTALAGIKYNEGKYKIAAGIALLIGGAVLPIRSLQLSFEYLLENCDSANKKAIFEQRAHLIELLQQAHEDFIKKSPEEKQDFITRFKDTAQPLRYLASASSEREISQVCNYIGLGIGWILAGMFEYAFTDYTFVETKNELQGNSIIGGLLASSVLLCSFYLTVQSVVRISKKAFNLAGTCLQRNPLQNLSWQLRPKQSTVLAISGLLINFAALGPSWIMWKDFYNNDHLTGRVFPPTLCFATLLFFYKATLDINDQFLSFLLHQGNEQETAIAKMDGKFKSIIHIMKHCPDEELNLYCQENDWTRPSLETTSLLTSNVVQ